MLPDTVISDSPPIIEGRAICLHFFAQACTSAFSQGAVLEPIMPMIIKVSLMVNGKEEGGHLGSPFPLFYFD